MRAKEAMSINKSLSCLADVVAARANKKPHVPYRNSTLTYVLQDSLEGDCKTVMIAQISPAESNSDESYSTLNFASRVRKVEQGQVPARVLMNDWLAYDLAYIFFKCEESYLAHFRYATTAATTTASQQQKINLF